MSIAGQHPPTTPRVAPPAAPSNCAGDSRSSFWVSRSWLPPVLAVGLLTCLTVLVFHDQLFDHWTFPWDFLGDYTTTPAFVGASIENGHLLSWSPFVASGFPVDVNPQAGLYFPGWWLAGLLRIPLTLRVLTAVQVAHTLFGSVGVLMLARVRRVSWLWATVAAVAYLFFGGFYGETEHADIVRGFAYTPWLLWCLTPPSDDDGRWLRLAALPPLTWLIVSGAYPGQLAAFAVTGLVYVVVALRVGGGSMWRDYRVALLLAVVATGAVCAAVLLPYLRAEQMHELHRVFEPTAAVRAGESLGLRDLLGLYLNNFAWTPDGTVTSWAVGVPVLIGIACIGWDALRRHAPLVICGGVALVLAMAPNIGVVGRAMASLQPLFPSRFPAAEYKAVVAVALVVLAAESWSRIAAQHRSRAWRDAFARSLPWRAMFAGCVLLGGALLAPATYAQPTRALWLVVVVIAACVVLVILSPRPRVLACVLVALIAVDGVREAYDYRLLGHTSPWRVPPSETTSYLGRDGDVRELAAHLRQKPATRPARVPPAAPLEKAPTGSNLDSSGWIAADYYLIDYGGTIERALWEAEHNPALLGLLLEPWHAYTFPCATAGCDDGKVHLPAAATWKPSSGVRTLSYGEESIVYEVNVPRPTLMVENELAIRGWQSNMPLVRQVKAGIPLRAWRLSPGHYQFAASYHQPGRILQYAFLTIALVAWVGCVLVLRRQKALTLCNPPTKSEMEPVLR